MSGQRGRWRTRVVACGAALLMMLVGAPAAGASTRAVAPEAATAALTSALPAGAAAPGLDDLRSRLPELTYGQPVELGVPGAPQWPVAITRTGVVAGVTTVDGVQRAFRWRDGRTEVMPVVATYLHVVDVNDRGQVVGNTSSAGPEPGYGFLWDVDGAVLRIGGPDESITAAGINAHGVVAGTRDRYSRSRAVIWRDGVVTDLGALGAGAVSVSDEDAINDRGEVVGVSFVGTPDAGVLARGFVWRDGAMSELPGPPRAHVSARGITESGDVLGSVDDPDGRDGTVVWEDGVLRFVYTSTDPERRLHPSDLNEKGVVVGRVERRGTGVGVVVDADGTLRRLRALGGDRTDPAAVHDLGIVVGSATREPGRSDLPHACLWVLGVPVALGERVGGLTVVASVARDVNARGQVVGTVSTPGPRGFESRVVLWELVPGR